MGDGHQRPLDCSNCEGLASKQRVLAPVAIAASPDGSIYLADFNLIRRMGTDGIVKTLLRLKCVYIFFILLLIDEYQLTKFVIFLFVARPGFRIVITWHSVRLTASSTYPIPKLIKSYASGI